ncbi:MAG: hypothetical protein KF770_28795 [Anaerolineae bacterium]|nr:hypothetical protein [Anaerolineae bacterium]
MTTAVSPRGKEYTNQPAFATFYGRDAHLPDGPGLYFYNFAPQASPDGRYLALPGIGGYDNPAGDLGTGFWLADLQTGSARLLLPQAHPFTWSPDSQAITFTDSGVLYTLHVAGETAVPAPLFSHPDLVDLWARWSPDGPIGTIRWTADNAHLVMGGGTPNAPIWLLAAQPGSVPEVVVEQGVLVDVVSAPDTAIPATICGWLP